uniref:Uncharacterized protein n=1 Tax=Bionectria ochroleuca TaxID=29856 RepID=A0A0B7KJA0_BIOOC
MASIAPRQSVCRRCLRLARPPKSCQTRNYTSPGPRERTVVESQDEKKDISQPSESPPKDPKSSSSSPSQPGAMTRRLQEATEDALLTGGRTSQKLVEDAGFSEELKEKLFNKVKEAQFRKRFSSAFAEAGISSSSSAVGEGSHHIATAAPWTGKETTHDAVLRMLDDSKKPLSPELRGKFRTPVPVDMRIKRDPAMSASQRPRPLLPPFRDPDWEAAERTYMELSIDNLNSITRTYNLMAPDLAKKPYFSLQRELLGAFAEVAPQLANEIKERTTRVKSPGLGGGRHQTAAAGIFENFGGGSSPRIRLEAEEKAYGFKDWWRDVWKK